MFLVRQPFSKSFEQLWKLILDKVLVRAALRLYGVHSFEQMESLYRWSAQKWLLKIANNEQSLLRFGVFYCQCRLELTDDVDFCLPWTEKLLVCLLV